MHVAHSTSEASAVHSFLRVDTVSSAAPLAAFASGVSVVVLGCYGTRRYTG